MGNEAQDFQMRSWGQVFVSRRLDHEMTHSYLIQLVASDGFLTFRAWVRVPVYARSPARTSTPPFCVNTAR